MKKLVNDPFAVVDEMIDGYVAAHPDLVKRAPGGNGRAVVRADAPIADKVGVIIGGGSGHEPAFMGYVGQGSADGCPVGNVFASPPPDPILAATRAVNGGAGVIYSYGNYAGDVMNFDMAAELAGAEGIEVRTVLVTDDVASAPSTDDRRGIAGGFFVFKAIAARAAEMVSLAEVETTARKANARTRTMGVALSACTVPAAGRPTFSLDETEMEIGLGIHGEPGMRYAAGQRRTCRRFGERTRRDAGNGTLHHVPPRRCAPERTRRHDSPQLRRRVCDIAGDGGRLGFAHPSRRRTGAPDRRPGAHPDVRASLMSDTASTRRVTTASVAQLGASAARELARALGSVEEARVVA